MLVGVHTVAVMSCHFFLAIGWWLVGVCCGAPMPLLQALLEIVPSDPGTVATIFGVVSCHVFARRRTLIFDDVTNVHDKTLNANVRDYITHSVLPELHRLSLTNNVILISSNEGIHYAFSDPSPTVRDYATMPMPTMEEMYQTLCRMGVAESPRRSTIRSIAKTVTDTTQGVMAALGLQQRSESITLTSPLTEKDLQLVCEMWGKEYGLSARFWKTVLSDHFVHHLRSGRPPARALIHYVCKTLDLACQPAFKIAALCVSRTVQFTALSKLFPEHPDAAEKAAELMQSEGAPRRLALAVMFVVTADKADVDERELLMAVRNEIPRFSADLNTAERGMFRERISPLATHLAVLLDVWIEECWDGQAVGQQPVRLRNCECATIDDLQEAIGIHIKVARPLTIFTRASGSAEANLVKQSAETKLRNSNPDDPYFYEVGSRRKETEKQNYHWELRHKEE